MKVIIADDNKLYQHYLPNVLNGGYSIPYKNDNSKFDYLITFKEDEGNCYIQSNGTINIIENDSVINQSIVNEYSTYTLKIIGVSSLVRLFIYPDVETKLYTISTENKTSIKLGNNSSNDLIVNNPLVSSNHVELSCVNNNWQVFSSNQENKFYVNNHLEKLKALTVGDVIFIGGIKIIWMGKFFAINNPLNQVGIQNLVSYNLDFNEKNDNYEGASEEEKVVELFSEDDYFFQQPRLQEYFEEEKVLIDPPPVSFVKEELPFILTLGTSITMMASSFMMIYNIYYSSTTGSKSLAQLLPQIILVVAMVIGSLIFPRIIASYQKKKNNKKEQERIDKYGAYLEKKEKEIIAIMTKQAQILNENVLSTKDCLNVINSKTRNFWSRNLYDHDFLAVRLGVGDIKPLLEVSAPEEHFSLDVDNMLQKVYDMVNKHKILKDVPVSYSFVDKKVSAIISETSDFDKYVQNLITQLVSLHSVYDLKIVILTDKNKEKKWEFAKFLPHCFSEDKSKRFICDSVENTTQIMSYLEKVYQDRTELINQNSEEIKRNDGHKNFPPYYLIICDEVKNKDEYKLLKRILNADENFGFSIIYLEKNLKTLPNKCENFIEIEKELGFILEKRLSSNSQIKFKPEIELNLNMREISKMLFNIPTKTKDGDSVLPTALSFLEMYGVSRIEQLNILNKWKENNPMESLQAPIGVHTNGELFNLNLHEKKHGPHGLIAGSTGSGKSEFILTYILSMAVNYHPYEVQFVLIDYKGGGLAGAFNNKETGVKLPHLAGTITNLDLSEMNRTLVSIESELKRRQMLFNKVRDALGEGTIDIYKYQKLYREGLVEEPMSHLFIISDEFAELKSQQPEFMAQLISTARIGRSLGVHLILATQKPSGVVNDQIWSNSKFKVCLKVQERSDSMEMLKRPEAASLKEVGRFYLQVGYNEFFDIGQSAWAGAKYIPSDKILLKTDDSIDFINTTGSVIKKIKDTVVVDTSKNYGEQLTNLVKYIYDLGKNNNIATKQLWLDSIPEIISIEQIKKQYNYKPEPYFLNPVIGIVDKPEKQVQELLNIDLSFNNTVIYGQTGSGKEHLLSTILWSSIVEHTPDEVNIYVVDCGSEYLKMYSRFPHVGEVVGLDEADKISELMNMLFDELEYRKELFSEFAGSYENYNNNSGKKMPMIVTVINNYEIFCENFLKLSEAVQPLYRDGSKYGIVFVVSAVATNALRSRMQQNFLNKIALQIPNEGEYRYLLNAPRGLQPAKYFGRGLIQDDKTAYEFQTAAICSSNEINQYLKNVAVHLNSAYTVKAKKIPIVPDVVMADSLKVIDDMVPIGYEMDSKKINYYDFFSDKYNLILASYMDNYKMNFVYSLINYFKDLNTNVVVIDLVEAIEKEISDINIYNSDFEKNIIEINNDIIKNKDSESKFMYIVLGVGDVKNKLGNAYPVFENLMLNIDKINNVNFVFIDVYDSVKKLQVENWFTEKVNKKNGIWLGENVANQLIFNLNNLEMNDRNVKFPYMGLVIQKGNYKFIRFTVCEVLNEE